jgi:hypothetical protein
MPPRATAYALSLAQQYLPSGGAPQPFPAPPTRRALAPLAAPLSLLRRLFLPRGELPPDYATFQLLDCLQGLCSYLRGGIAMHATLTGLGLGREHASALAATLALMLKEGAAHVASLAFALAVASRLDGEVRFWRLAADVANDLGLALELAAPLGGAAGFLPLTCAANACKAVCGVAAGATRVAISAHFASGRSGALVAEVAAKEGTQETAVTLAGLVLGMLLAPLLNSSAGAQWASFALLTLVHVVANAAAVRCLALRTLSRTRALLLLEASARVGAAGAAAGAAGGSSGSGRSRSRNRSSSSSSSSSKSSDTLPTPSTLREREPLLPVQYARLLGIRAGGEGGRLRLGCSLDALREGALLAAGAGGAEWQGLVRWSSSSSSSGSGGGEGTLAEALAGGGGPPLGADFFLLAAAPSGQAWVAFSAAATPRTQLRGWLAALAALGHASARAVVGGGGGGGGGGAAGGPAARVEALLAQWEAAGWDLTLPALEEEGWRVELVERAGKEE